MKGSKVTPDRALLNEVVVEEKELRENYKHIYDR